MNLSNPTPQSLTKVVRTMLGAGREPDPYSTRPGPWDPLVRGATHWLANAGPSPTPWAWTHPHHRVHELPLVNPHLPPRYAFLQAVAQSFIERAELLQELATATAVDGQPPGADHLGGYVSHFVHDWCETEFIPRWPFPGPPPPWWLTQLDAVDLVVLGLSFEQAALRSFDRKLAEDLAGAAHRFLDAGLARL